jgi:hypothetical protein
VASFRRHRCRRRTDGLPSESAAAELDPRNTRWQVTRRFIKGRCGGLLDSVRFGRPRTINGDQVAASTKLKLDECEIIGRNADMV